MDDFPLPKVKPNASKKPPKKGFLFFFSPSHQIEEATLTNRKRSTSASSPPETPSVDAKLKAYIDEIGNFPKPVIEQEDKKTI